MEKTGNEVKLEKRVTVYGTGKGYMTSGKAYKVHPLNAKYLVDNGKATFEKVPEKIK